MDEPFGALDAMTRDLLHDELERLWRDTDLTILFVTHNVREAVRLGDRVVLLSSRPGRVIDRVPGDDRRDHAASTRPSRRARGNDHRPSCARRFAVMAVRDRELHRARVGPRRARSITRPSGQPRAQDLAGHVAEAARYGATPRSVAARRLVGLEARDADSPTGEGVSGALRQLERPVARRCARRY